MSKELMFVQCTIQKFGLGGILSQVWIPEKFAIKERYIKVKINGEWEDNWQVIKVFEDIKKTEQEANIDAEAWKYQRGCSDI